MVKPSQDSFFSPNKQSKVSKVPQVKAEGSAVDNVSQRGLISVNRMLDTKNVRFNVGKHHKNF
jgi:hypothetical protein